MLTLKTIDEIKRYSLGNRAAGLSIGFVPTMGYLHEGHLSLVRLARSQTTRVIVSIFVNPLQFNDVSDLEKYPRDIERDIDLLQAEKVDAVFCPSNREVYPHGQPSLTLKHPLMNEMCGKTRPNHFEGMLLVVHNLLQWVKPDYAFFGQKDYQQLKLIEVMNRDLHMGANIVPAPISREPDGLAMSSRNARLSTQGRAKAALLSKALFAARDLFQKQNLAAQDLNRYLSEQLLDFTIDYAGVFHRETLKPLEAANNPVGHLLALAAYVDGIRLIDNVLLDGSFNQ